jgi:chemotaxis signal transduction protein
MQAKKLRLAQASIGAVHLAIPVEAVVQAIPLPDTPAFLPRRHGALRGVVEHLGALVPVVDLARWVETGTSVSSQDARILVLHEGGRTIGLQVDAVGGLLDVPPHLLTRLHHDDNPEDVFHTAVHSPDDGRILSLLEVGRLADLAVAWSQAEFGSGTAAAAAPSSATAAASASVAPASASRTWALLQTGHGRLAVPPGDLTEVIPLPPLARFGGGIDSAYCIWRGRHLPVLAAGALMAGSVEAGRVEAGVDRLLAVIEHAGLALGVPVRAALQMCAFEGSGLPADDGVTATLYDADGIEIRLLDTARLFKRFPEAALSKPAAAANDTGSGKPAPQRSYNKVGYIVFEADGLGATPVGAIEHILPLAGTTAATMDWHGAAIPMVDLRGVVAGTPVAGTRAAGASANVLVVQAGAGHVGYVVARVHSMIPPGTGTLYRMGSASGAGLEFITTGEGAEQASYRTFDLVARAAA